MTKWAYELTDNELITLLVNRAKQAGVANSAFVLDPSANYVNDQLKYIRGVLLARINSVIPPYPPGTILKLIHNNGLNEKFKVKRIYYTKNESWELEFFGDIGSIYSAEQYEPV